MILILFDTFNVVKAAYRKYKLIVKVNGKNLFLYEGQDVSGSTLPLIS